MRKKTHKHGLNVSTTERKIVTFRKVIAYLTVNLKLLILYQISKRSARIVWYHKSLKSSFIARIRIIAVTESKRSVG